MILGISFVKLIVYIALWCTTFKILSSLTTSSYRDNFSDGVEEAYLNGRLRPKNK